MSAVALGAASAAQWQAQAAPPAKRYARDGEPGVLHLGLGAFHRAHQAMVFDRLLAAGDGRWGIHGVGMRQAGLVQSLRKQDGLYAVRVADAQAVQWVIPAALWRLSLLSTQQREVLAAIARPSLRWITLTVTEKGYTPELGWLIAQGLSQRRQAGAAGLTLASCDNLRNNGQQLRQLVLRACDSATLCDWVDSNCAFPSSMVDRIVPASSPAVRELALKEIGLIDESPLSTEGFWEWVVENRFADPGDATTLAAAGVRVTDQVAVYEEAKLRMLNGSHSAMALMGAITGRPTISSCIEQPSIRSYIHRLIEREVAPHLQRQDWSEYRDALMRRFANPHLRHSVHQIATDSSVKIPQRWPPSVEGQLQKGQGIDHHALTAAAWLRYALAEDENGQPYAISDPQGDSLKALGARQVQDPQGAVRELLSREEFWGPILSRHPHWHARVAHWHRAIVDHGMDAALQQLLKDFP